MAYIMLFIVLLIVMATFIYLSFGGMSTQKLKALIVNHFGVFPTDTDYGFGSIAAYHKFFCAANTVPKAIDDLTWNDLDMDRIFKLINNCGSSVGEEYLYHMLHLPQFEDEKLPLRQGMMDYLHDHPDLRLDLQLSFHRMGKKDFNGLSGLIFDGEYKKLENAGMYRLLGALPALCLLIMPFALTVGLPLLIIFSGVNIVVHYCVKHGIEHELSTLSYLSSLLYCCGKVCETVPDSFSRYTKNMSDALKELDKLRGKIPGTVKRGLSDFDVFTDLVDMLFLFSVNSYSHSMELIVKHQSSLDVIFCTLGELEAAIATLSFRQSLPYCCEPKFTPREVSFTNIFHPLIEAPIGNSGQLCNDSIITGSNASGKSTFIKALAVNGILAQTIHTCTADSFTTFYSTVITSMAVKDSITNGESYFIAEIRSLKRIIDATAAGRCCCYIDEILKGTNTVERIAASAAVLRHLHGTDSLYVVASHDLELTEILHSLYDSYHFSEQVTDFGIEFDYKLKTGAATTRNAILLLDFMDFDESIVKDAYDLVEHFTAAHSWV